MCATITASVPAAMAALKGRKINLVDLFAGSIHGGQSQMRISSGVTMSGKMLGRGEKAIIARSANVSALPARLPVRDLPQKSGC